MGDLAFESNFKKTSDANLDIDDRILAAAFGEISGLLMRSPQFKTFAIQDLAWLVLPGIQTLNYSIARASPRDRSLSVPVGAVLWASVSAEVDARLSADFSALKGLTAADWKSGNCVWIVLAEGREDVVRGILGKLAVSHFQGKSLKTKHPLVASLVNQKSNNQHI